MYRRSVKVYSFEGLVSQKKKGVLLIITEVFFMIAQVLYFIINKTKNFKVR